MPRQRRKITRDFYNLLLAAYREMPNNAQHAGDSAGCDRRTAKKGWETGWPKTAIWAKPIKDVIAGEKIAARAKLSEESKATQDDREERYRTTEKAARDDAIDSRGEEALLVRAARVNAGRYQQASAQMMVGVNALAKRVRLEMEALNTPVPNKNGDLELPKANVTQLTRLIQTVASAIRQGNEAALIAMRMERLHLGLPGDVGAYDEMTTQEAAEHLQRGDRMLKRAEARGFVVYEGGKGKTANGGGDGDGHSSTG